MAVREPAITFLSHTAAASGAELATVRLATALRSMGVTSTVLFTQDGPMVAELSRRGVPVRVVSGQFDSTKVTIGGARIAILSGAWQMVRLGWDIGEVIRTSGSTVVVAESTKALLMGAVAARRARVPVIWHVHDRVSSEFFGTAMASILRFLGWSVSSGYIANSNSTLQSLMTYRKRSVVAYPGVEAVDVAVHVQRPPDQVRIVMVGRLERWKGQDLLLRALARSAFKPQATFVGGAHFGEDFGGELAELVTELGLTDSVTFTGHVSDPSTYLADADIAVHCSRTTEPFGQVIVEAMAAGCAVIAANAGGPLEIVTDAVDGLLVDPTDIEALTQALDNLIGDPVLRWELAERARSTVARFTVEETAATVDGFLRAPSSNLVRGRPNG
ncbi:UNVERIFIED_CONTAM: glycosyltransferase involved in cell wall biosynthesis [Williamsia faeni]